MKDPKGPDAFKRTWVGAKLAGRVSERLGGYFAAHLWFTPWPVPVSERGQAKQAGWLAETIPMTFRVGGKTIEAFSAGNGPAVVLTHGWGETGASLGAFIEPLVASGHRVVGITMPAHGASRQVETNLFEGSEVLRGVVAEVDATAVIAHSIGGAVATIALSEGMQLDRVALIAPVSNVHHAIDTFRVLLDLPEGTIRGLRSTIERRFGTDVWARLESPRLARRFHVPALIVHDRDDDQVDVGDSQVLAAMWKGAHLITTEGLGHAKLLRDQRVIDDVVSFLTGDGLEARAAV